MADALVPRVLMVTGAYYPELSGGGLQCKAIVDALSSQARFAVLTTCTDSALSLDDDVDGTPVHRVYVDISKPQSKMLAAAGFIRQFMALSSEFDIVHLHGFSQKSTLVVLLAKLFRKRVVLTLHTAGQDEPVSVRAQGALAYWAYSHADLWIAISSRLAESIARAGLPVARLWRGSNGLDVRRFRPAEPGEQAVLRGKLDLPASGSVILFVGFFSADKGPHILFEAWRRIATTAGAGSSLLFIGAATSSYFEVDPRLANDIRHQAEREGLAARVLFVEETRAIEEYYRASDIFVFPSRREGFGMALVEAMASGLPCIASRLPGATDEIITDHENGLLVEPHDVPALSGVLERLLRDTQLAAELGRAGRSSVEQRFSIEQTARRTLEAYRHVAEPV